MPSLRIMPSQQLAIVWEKDHPDPNCPVCRGNQIARRLVGGHCCLLREEKPCDSLLGLAYAANVPAANALGAAELVAVVYCVAHAPFCPQPAEAYALVVRNVQETGTAMACRALGIPGAESQEPFQSMLQITQANGLGQTRFALVQRAGDGCNAPIATYLRVAFKAQAPSQELLV